MSGGIQLASRGSGGARSEEQVRAAAGRGLAGPQQQFPHLEQIQSSFGQHSVEQVQAVVGGPAAEASAAMGAVAFASGDSVAFAGAPDLRTAAHEAAHVVQQRGGVQLKDGVGQPGDTYERQADEVADRVEQGQSAEDLLSTAAPAPRGEPAAGEAAAGGSSARAAGLDEPAVDAVQKQEASGLPPGAEYGFSTASTDEGTASGISAGGECSSGSSTGTASSEQATSTSGSAVGAEYGFSSGQADQAGPAQPAPAATPAELLPGLQPADAEAGETAARLWRENVQPLRPPYDGFDPGPHLDQNNPIASARDYYDRKWQQPVLRAMEEISKGFGEGLFSQLSADLKRALVQEPDSAGMFCAWLRDSLLNVLGTMFNKPFWQGATAVVSGLLGHGSFISGTGAAEAQATADRAAIDNIVGSYLSAYLAHVSGVFGQVRGTLEVGRQYSSFFDAAAQARGQAIGLPSEPHDPRVRAFFDRIFVSNFRLPEPPIPAADYRGQGRIAGTTAAVLAPIQIRQQRCDRLIDGIQYSIALLETVAPKVGAMVRADWDGAFPNFSAEDLAEADALNARLRAYAGRVDRFAAAVAEKYRPDLEVRDSDCIAGMAPVENYEYHLRVFALFSPRPVGDFAAAMEGLNRDFWEMLNPIERDDLTGELVSTECSRGEHGRA